MGVFDFLKRKVKVVEEEGLSFSELGVWLDKRVFELGEKRKIFLGMVKNRVAELVVELTEELHVLNGIDIDKKKERERIKAIVKENHNNYMIHLERLITRLSEMSNDQNIIGDINLIFSDFKKRSAMNYEKATFLIGKEMGNVKESIGVFFKDVGAIVEKNKKFMDEVSAIDGIKKSFTEYNELVKKKSELEGDMERDIERVVHVKELSKKKRLEIEKLKGSKRFIEEGIKFEELNKKKEKLDKVIYDFSRVIDFKVLANYYHSFEKDMALIKRYRDDFRFYFDKNFGEDIVLLIKEAGLYNERISEFISVIKVLKREITDIKIKDIGLYDLEKELKDLELMGENINQEIFDNKKRIEKINEGLDNLRGKLREELLRLCVRLD